MGLLYVSQKSKWSSKKGVKPYSKSKKQPAYLQGVYKPTVTVFRREVDKLPSLHTTGYSACVKPANKQYTGDNILGIGTMHKSNAVPIFNEREAKEISSMRRN